MFENVSVLSVRRQNVTEPVDVKALSLQKGNGPVRDVEM
jgi:hypothetical protein